MKKSFKYSLVVKYAYPIGMSLLMVIIMAAEASILFKVFSGVMIISSLIKNIYDEAYYSESQKLINMQDKMLSASDSMIEMLKNRQLNLLGSYYARCGIPLEQWKQRIQEMHQEQSGAALPLSALLEIEKGYEDELKP